MEAVTSIPFINDEDGEESVAEVSIDSGDIVIDTIFPMRIRRAAIINLLDAAIRALQFTNA